MTALRLLLVAVAAGAAIAPMPAGWIERWYSRWFYLTLQHQLTAISNVVPIALLDAAIASVLAALIVVLSRRWRRDGPRRAVWRTSLTLVTIAAAIYIGFLVTWGLNYRRVPLEEKLDFDHARITPAAARQLGDLAIDRANALRAQHEQPRSSPALDSAFAAALDRLGTGRAVPGVPKKSLLGYYFRLSAIDGITVPIFLEIIVNPDVLPFERDFVVAHEWAHLAGYASEAEANFVAWMTCAGGDADAQYSGWLAVYEHVWSVLPRADRTALSARVSDAVRGDLVAMVARYERSRPVVRNTAREVYDGYLRANRVRDGIASYTGVVRLLLGAGVADGRLPVVIAR
jgi:hypothetical protein